MSNNTTYSFFGGQSLNIVCAIIGYFLYGRSIEAALGIFVLTVIYDITILFGFIPLLGIPIQILLIHEWIAPRGFALFGLHSTWLTKLIFVCPVIIGAIISIVVFFAIMIKVFE